MAVGRYIIYGGSKYKGLIEDEMTQKDPGKLKEIMKKHNGRVPVLFALRYILPNSNQEVTVDYHETQVNAYRQAIKNARGKNYQEVKVDLLFNGKASVLYSGAVD